MSTDASTDINSDGLWVSVREMSRLKGVDVAVISRRVAKFVEDGKLETKPGPRGAKLINRAVYDRLVGETGDPVKEQAADTARLFRDDAPLAPKGDDAPDPATQRGNAAKREEAIYNTELKKIELGEKRKELVAIGQVAEARDRCGNAIAQVIERLPLRASEVAAAVARDGEAGARAALTTIAFDLGKAITAALRELAAEGQAQEAAGLITAQFELEEALAS